MAVAEESWPVGVPCCRGLIGGRIGGRLARPALGKKQPLSNRWSGLCSFLFTPKAPRVFLT